MKVDKTTPNQNRRFQKIDSELLKEIRLTLPVSIYSYIKIDTDIIVPENFTHTYLKNNFEIDEPILKHYFAPTQDLIYNDEYKELVKSGLICKKWKVLEPYSIIIGNAYYSRADLFIKLGLINRNAYNLICEGKEVEYLTDLTPYFKEYSNGFKHGFNDFNEECIEPFLTMFPDKKDYTNKVFEFITKEIPLTHSWATYGVGFTTNYNMDTKKHILTGGFEDGQKQGYFYKAWSIIFSNHKLFTPLFKEFKSKRTTQETPPTKESVLLENEITHPKRKEIAKAIKRKYSSYKNKDFKILHEALLHLDLFPKKGKRMSFFRCLQNEGYHIKNHQMLEDIHFKKGTRTKKGSYFPSDDEIQKDKIVTYLKTIIETK